MAGELVLRTNEQKKLTKFQKTSIFTSSIFRIRRPLIDISARRIREGTATQKDFLRMLKSNDPQQISMAIAALIPRDLEETTYRQSGKSAIAGAKELQIQLAKRLVTREFKINAKKACIVGGSLASIGMVGVLANLPAALMAFPVLIGGAVVALAYRTANHPYRRELAKHAEALRKKDITDEAKRILTQRK
jgi:hypothetical protein